MPVEAVEAVEAVVPAEAAAFEEEWAPKACAVPTGRGSVQLPLLEPAGPLMAPPGDREGAHGGVGGGGSGNSGLGAPAASSPRRFAASRSADDMRSPLWSATRAPFTHQDEPQQNCGECESVARKFSFGRRQDESVV